jgi:hypothetical protein
LPRQFGDCAAAVAADGDILGKRQDVVAGQTAFHWRIKIHDRSPTLQIRRPQNAALLLPTEYQQRAERINRL